LANSCKKAKKYSQKKPGAIIAHSKSVKFGFVIFSSKTTFFTQRP
jgi:hypothetical protein